MGRGRKMEPPPHLAAGWGQAPAPPHAAGVGLPWVPHPTPGLGAHTPVTAQGPHLSLKALLQEDRPKGVKVVRLGAAGPAGWRAVRRESRGRGRQGPGYSWSWAPGGPRGHEAGLASRGAGRAEGRGGAGGSPGRAEALDGRQHLVVIRIILGPPLWGCASGIGHPQMDRPRATSRHPQMRRPRAHAPSAEAVCEQDDSPSRAPRGPREAKGPV